jgi:hypothetical protein
MEGDGEMEREKTVEEKEDSRRSNNQIILNNNVYRN